MPASRVITKKSPSTFILKTEGVTKPVSRFTPDRALLETAKPSVTEKVAECSSSSA